MLLEVRGSGRCSSSLRGVKGGPGGSRGDGVRSIGTNRDGTLIIDIAYEYLIARSSNDVKVLKERTSIRNK